jgi:predicted ATPase
MVLRNIEKTRNILHISLQPLQLTHIENLVADTFRCSTKNSNQLAQLVQEKTLGNPFFMLIFLTNLVQEGLIHFNHLEGKWEWDLKKIQEQNITSNVIDMTTRRIQKLEPQTQRILSLAASIGNKFELATLAVISEQTVKQTAKDLWPAIKGKSKFFLCSFFNLDLASS